MTDSLLADVARKNALLFAALLHVPPKDPLFIDIARELDVNKQTELQSLNEALAAENAQLQLQNEKLQTICASAYQMAGALNAPVRFLDVLANPLEATAEQIDTLLPISQGEPGVWDDEAEKALIRRDTIEECIREVEKERLYDNTGEPEDIAYGSAIDDAIAALRSLGAGSQPTEPASVHVDSGKLDGAVACQSHGAEPALKAAKSALIDADHLAECSERLLSALNKQAGAEAACEVRKFKSNVLALQNAQEAVSEYWRAVREATHEYRKRAERFRAALPSAAPIEREAPNDAKAFCFDEWQEKTNWVQEQISTFPITAIGKHRADVMREEIERLRAALAAPAVPEGFALVPIEPPKAGSDADWLLEVRDEFNGSVCDWAAITDIYRAIIAAAPLPATPLTKEGE